jgi:hypothetical protein
LLHRWSIRLPLPAVVVRAIVGEFGKVAHGAKKRRK